MSWISNAGKAISKGVKDTGKTYVKGAKDIGHTIGDAQNNKWVKGAEMAALAASGVGIPASMALMAGAGALGGAMRHGGGLKGALTEGGQGALQGLGAGAVGDVVGHGGMGAGNFAGKVGSALKGGGGVALSGAKKVGSGALHGGEALASGVGNTLENTFTKDGGLDLGKTAAIVGAGLDMKGRHDQRKSAEAYNNSQIDQRNQLMGQILGPTNYNLPDISDSIKTASAPVGPPITPRPLDPNAQASKKLATTQNQIQ